jgi:hypothetical protein
MNWAKIILTSSLPAAALGLALSLSSGPAQAHCAGKHTGDHPHCADDPGDPGDTTFAITITDNASLVGVAAGDGVESPGGTIEGLTGAGSFEAIVLGSITADSGLSVTDDYNSFEVCGSNENVNPIEPSHAIDALQIQHNHEIDEIVVVVGYSGVDGQSFTLLLQGLLDASETFPPTELTDYPLVDWNNRGGGKGKKNRCGTGPRDLSASGVDLLIEPQEPQ